MDGSRTHLNIDYCNERIQTVYHQLFDEALKRYNEKQARADRRIPNYYVKPKLKLNTWLTKEHIIQKKILPYLGKRKLSEITAKDIICWQNEIRGLTDSKGQHLSTTYLKTIHNQMSAIFNHAIKFYGLQVNPAAKAGSMGEKESHEMNFWTKDEFLKFIDAMMDSPIHYYAFEMLYWCGLRLGELLALTPDDFDFDAGTVSITKSYQRIKKQDVITPPKTKKSIRIIQMPDFLAQEIQDYLKMLYGVEHDSRIFPLTKNGLKRAMEKGCKHLLIQCRVVFFVGHYRTSSWRFCFWLFLMGAGWLRSLSRTEGRADLAITCSV